MIIETHPKDTFIKLLWLIFSLLFLNILGIVSRFYFNHDSVYGLIPLFDFDTEKNVPTFYSSIALLFSSTLLLIIASIHKNNGTSYISWLGLALIFIFLSVDEFTSIHEDLGKSTRDALNIKATGIFYFSWYIPYGIATLAFVMTYLKFLITLPKSIMILFIISGSTFVTGAIGFEMLCAEHIEQSGTNNLMYSFLYSCEEFLEMLGIVIFIYTLLSYIVSQFGSLSVTINKSK